VSLKFAPFQRFNVQMVEEFSTRAPGLFSQSLGDYIAHSSGSVGVARIVTGALKNRLKAVEIRRSDVSYYIQERSHELLGNYSPCTLRNKRRFELSSSG